MGKKTKVSNNQKSIKSNKLTINKIFNSQSNIKISNMQTKQNKNIKLNQNKKNVIFDKQLSELYQRNTLIKHKKVENKLSIAEPRFLYNGNSNVTTNIITISNQTKSSINELDMIDVLLKDEKDPKPNQISMNKDNNNNRNKFDITSKNRFELLENDEILEDGIVYDIL